MLRWLTVLILLTACKQDAVVLRERQARSTDTDCTVAFRFVHTNRVVVYSKYCGYMIGDTVQLEAW